MAILSVEHVSFSFAEKKKRVLHDINFSIAAGSFTVVAGKSGSGKSTLLQLIKSEIAPYGKMAGDILYNGESIATMDPQTLAKEIGFVFQDPENQIVMDTVLAELSFGLENFQYTADEMHKRIAEIVHYFDMAHVVDRKTADLSGGEKQVINLASVLLLEPTLLLLDEPLAQLDPIAAKEFVYTLKQLNEELGLTIVIVEHQLDELLAFADQLIVLEDGKILFDDVPRHVLNEMIETNTLVSFLPESTQLYAQFAAHFHKKEVPITVNEAIRWLKGKTITANERLTEQLPTSSLLELKNIDFQYGRDKLPILKDMQLTIDEREIVTIVGANGTGKSTLLKIILGIFKQQHGYFRYAGKRKKSLVGERFGYLPQQPQLVFIKETIGAEFEAIANQYDIDERTLEKYVSMFQLNELLDQHPYDLSGGELQRAAILTSVLTKPDILFLDEPTKGIDPEMKEVLGTLFVRLQQEGMTIVMVTHDVEFAARYSDRCGLLFQGELVAVEPTQSFFNGNAYYTTMLNRVTCRSDVPIVTTLEEAIKSWQIHE